jgi:hypothetical protein
MGMGAVFNVALQKKDLKFMKTLILPATGIRHADSFRFVFAYDHALIDTLETLESRLVVIRKLTSVQEIAPNEVAWRAPFECWVYRTRMLPGLRALELRGSRRPHEAFAANLSFPAMFEPTHHEVEPGDVQISVDIRGEFHLSLDRKIISESFSIPDLKRIAEQA